MQSALQFTQTSFLSSFASHIAGGSAMVPREQLQVKAQKYRDYVRWINDAEIARSILSLAAELEQRAMQPDEEDIRTRAYDLWRQAGEPGGRDEEFWHLAEQELRNEDKSSPLRTPDNL
jgi:Protein of unknown function (DUF2934)